MSSEILLKILDLARWAPSGDNTQPWRFEIVSGGQIAIHGFDTRDHVLYDFKGRPSQMAHGALLETIRIAATAFQLLAKWSLRPGCIDCAPIYDVFLERVPGLEPDSLLPFIEKRVVQRRRMQMTPLSEQQRQALINVVGPNYALQFIENFSGRWGVAKLLWENAYIRLTCPEAFEVHRNIIEWGVQFSCDRLPEQAIGVDPITAKLMKWVMNSWGRVDFFNRYLFGTVAPRLQLDLVPAIACSAHLLLRPCRPPCGLNDIVESGVAMQRLWLTATALGLYLQPEMTPVIFRWYAREGGEISQLPDINKKAHSMANAFERLVRAEELTPFSFFCRIGYSKYPSSRSTRKELTSLMQ
jgi:hypothetical protein